jgi:hypothetical protein
MRVQTPTKSASWQRRFRAAGFVAITLAGASFPLAAGSAPDAATENVSQALMSGQAWEAFCERLKEVGKEALASDAPGAELDRAEAYRFMVQQLERSIDSVLIRQDRAQPLLTLAMHRLYKFGIDSPEAKNFTAQLDSSGTYKLHGTLGTSRLLAAQVSQIFPDYKAFGSLSNEEIGRPGEAFEVLISREKPDGYTGAWLHLPPEADMLSIREYFHDWEKEQPAQLMLSRVDYVPGPPPIDSATMGRMLDEIAATFGSRVPMWLAKTKRVRGTLKNTLSPARQNAAQGLKDNRYGSGWFDLAEDEALVITLDAPDALMWSFQLANFWSESLDYSNHTSSINDLQAVASSDGKYRLIVSSFDPGVVNWLDTAWHREGLIHYRYQQSKNAPQPQVRLVDRNELGDVLPGDTRRVTRADRIREIEMRRAHTTLRWAP